MAILEEFGEHQCEVCGTDCVAVEEMLDQKDAKIAALEAQLAAKWIPVSERLPEDGVEVLICLGAFVHIDDGFASRYVAWLDYDDQPPRWIIAGNPTDGNYILDSLEV